MNDTAWLARLPHWLEQTSLGIAVRSTPALYPVLESLHVLGIALLVGSAFAVDLRLLGCARHVIPITVVTGHLLPLSHIGFAVVAATGAAMFIGNAIAVSSSTAAIWKFGLIIIAALNIVVFHTSVYRTVDRWDICVPTPLRAKAAAIISAVTWTSIIVAGRFLAY